MLSLIKKIIPKKIFESLQPVYHFSLATIGAIVCGFPSRKIKIVGVTGTKGKTSTTEFVNAILEEAGLKTAVASTLRFKVGDEVRPNLYKMTMPGRFFIQKFLKDAVDADCDWAVLEMTSEGVKQFRHKYIQLDSLIFTNISPEHIESHGSFENYLKAKLELGHSLERSSKKDRAIIANKDDKHGHEFLNLNVPRRLPFSLEDVKPYGSSETGITLNFDGEFISSKMKGVFNIENMLAAATFAKAYDIPSKTIKKALEEMTVIRGRVEYVVSDVNSKSQNFDVVVDYAHTPDSLEKFYEAFPRQKKICILGNTGGGRDKWKRPKMAEIADTYCSKIILTNEDPYDEDPMQILEEMKVGITKKPFEIVLDRREAINRGIVLAKELAEENKDEKPVILITGKGTDPYIMGPNGTKQKWDDATVVREELDKVLK